jgi:methyl-accepting chemotaxis protein
MGLKKLKIATRLGIGFTIMLLLLSAVAGVGYWRLHSVVQLNRYMVDDVLARQFLVAQWYANTNANGYRSLTLFRSSDAQQQMKLEKEIKATSAAITALQMKLDNIPTSSAEAAIFIDIADKRAAYVSARAAIIKERAAGNADAVARLIEESFQPALSAYIASFDRLIAFQDHVVQRTSAQLLAQAQSGQQVVLLIAAIGAALGAAISFFLARSIITPLRWAVQIADTVAKGDLSSNIEVSGNDELSQLLQAFKSMNDNLAGIVGEVRASSDLISSASQQIADGNADLSARTGQQAGALEQTASATEELTATVRQNGDSAQRAQQLAAAASEVAVKGGAVVAQVVETMGSINESSRRVVDIIGVIDGIAFQTNILALNAAVEAARAGEQGRGFAVVATEVRSLAQRSALAAKEIKLLVGASVEKVDIGAQLVDQAGSTMGDIVASVRRVNDIIGEMAVAGQEQLIGIEQINDALQRMDRLTQHNASLVDDSLTAAQATARQASTLARTVNLFKLGAAVQAAGRHPHHSAFTGSVSTGELHMQAAPPPLPATAQASLPC